MKDDLVYALQAMLPVCAMIEEGIAPLLPDIRAKFEEVGREVRSVRAAHTGDNATPIVYIDPEGADGFGGTAEEKAVLDWLDAAVKERVGIGARLEPGRGVPAAKG
jgi:hypothetical protein